MRCGGSLTRGGLQRADLEGYSEVAAAFRDVASSEEAQAMGHLVSLSRTLARALSLSLCAHVYA